MNWINRFKTVQEFNAIKRFLPYPSVSSIREISKTFLQQNETEYVLRVGTIVLHNTESNTTEYVYYIRYNATDYPISKYTPMGVVVIPQDFLAEESEARMMSLVEMSAETPEVGSTLYEGMNWGGFAYDGNSYTYHDIEGLANLSNKLQQFIGADRELSGSQGYDGILPSDKFTDDPAPFDKLAGYFYDSDAHIPSPYSYEWVSQMYGKGKSGDSFLVDINGKDNTDVLIAAETLQSTWQTDDAIISATSDERDYTNHFPPVLCCRRYHVGNTITGDWYLPAIGELGFVMSRLSVINAALAKVREVAGTQFAAPLDGHYYLSSSEFDQSHTYCLHAASGYVGGQSKYNSKCVRAFAVIPKSVICSANNEIWYTSSNWEIITPAYNTGFGANLLTNEYIDKGVYSFDGKVTNIGNEAFAARSSLTSIVIPDSVTNIGNHAFDGCIHLTSITIPNSITSFGDYAFNGCPLTSITIPNSVTSIGVWAFRDCSLTSLTIGNSVTSIGWAAFYGCSELTSVTIPNSVMSIGINAFSECPSLTSIVVESKNTTYDSRENCNAIIETVTNTLIAGCKNTAIPNTVTNIGEGAFYWCGALTSVTIPNSVASIGKDAFGGCYSLTSVIIGESVTNIGNSAFYNCSSLASITIPDSVTNIGEGAFYWCGALTSVTFDGTTEEWNSVVKGDDWSLDVPATYVQCTDGQVAL